jgi:hypothetical protein
MDLSSIRPDQDGGVTRQAMERRACPPCSFMLQVLRGTTALSCACVGGGVLIASGWTGAGMAVIIGVPAAYMLSYFRSQPGVAQSAPVPQIQ